MNIEFKTFIDLVLNDKLDLESLESLCMIKMCDAEILSIFFKNESYIIYKINY